MAECDNHYEFPSYSREVGGGCLARRSLTVSSFRNVRPDDRVTLCLLVTPDIKQV